MRRSQGERTAVLEAEVARLRDQQTQIMAAIVQLQNSFQTAATAINTINAGKLDQSAGENIATVVNSLVERLALLQAALEGNTQQAIMVMPRDRIHGDG